MSEDYWNEQANSWKAKHDTLKDTIEPTLERVKAFKANFGIKERSNGEIVIDFDKFVTQLGLESSLVLRQVIDDIHHVSGEPGEKPRLKVV